LQRVVQPAVLEVNGLADFGVKIEPVRKGGQHRGLVVAFRVSWWRKELPDLQAAYRELNRVRVGRMARLRGQVETVQAPGGASDPLLQKVEATVTAMREGGAPEGDIQAFVDGQAA
jgi:hypothetical protein